MHFLDLSNEIILQIADQFPTEHEVNTLACLNRRLHGLLNPYLYRRNVQRSGASAMFWAASRGNLDTARRVLECVKVDGKEATKKRVTPQLCQTGKVKEQKEEAAQTRGNEHEHEHAPGELCVHLSQLRLGMRGRNGETPLIYAAMGGKAAMVEFLLDEADSSVWEMDIYHQSALSHAAERGHAAVVELLLRYESGARFLNAGDTGGQTPLLWASTLGHDDVVRLLLAQKEIDVNSKTSEGYTPLLGAAVNGHVGVVELLLAKEGVDLNCKARDGMTPLAGAARNGDVEILKKLLAAGADPSVGDHIGRAPLCIAAEFGHAEAVRSLLDDKRVNVTQEDVEGQCALFIAAVREHEKIVRMLLDDERVEVDQRTHDGWTTFLLVSQLGNLRILKMLLEKGANPAIQSNMGTAPLHCASWKSNEPVIRLLLEQERIDPNVKDNAGWTALHWAADRGSEDVMKLLLSTKGVDINIRSDDGKTALSMAAAQGHAKLVKLLLAREDLESVDAADNAGRPPMYWAFMAGHADIVKLLVDAGASQEVSDGKGGKMLIGVASADDP
ncbi:hypothetical protein VTO42DRAFT_8890 [Malbranchea cinnamomea]